MVIISGSLLAILCVWFLYSEYRIWAREANRLDEEAAYRRMWEEYREKRAAEYREVLRSDHQNHRDTH